MACAFVIETEGLSKLFGSQRALDSVSLKVAPGAIGLLGPNGAGKSTFMKCLLQLQPITSGSARLLGREVGTEGREIRKRVGYSPEQNCHIPGMVGCEYVTYCAQLSGLPFQAARQRAHEMLDFVGMGQERYRKIDTYSTGMKQRLKLASAIVHDPEIVFLDEPTNGLDPKGQAQILELVAGLWKTTASRSFSRRTSCTMSSKFANRSLSSRWRQSFGSRQPGKSQGAQTRRRRSRARERAQRVAIRLPRRNWLCDMLPNGHMRIEHHADTLNPLLTLMHELKLPPLEIIPSPNALEETFVQALEISHAAV